MNITCKEIMPGVSLTTAECAAERECISIGMLTQLTRDNAVTDELLPRVLSRGTVRCADEPRLAAALADAGSMQIEPLTRCVGEIHSVGLRGSFTPGKPAGRQSPLMKPAQLICDMLTSPITRAGLLPQSLVQEEIAALCADKEKRLAAPGCLSDLCIEKMCCYEDYSAFAGTDTSSLEGLTHVTLSRSIYRVMLPVSPIEIFYCGQEKPSTVSAVFRTVLSGLTRGELDYDIGTDIRMNTVEEAARVVTEEWECPLNGAALGFRIGDAMDDDDPAPLFAAEALLRTRCDRSPLKPELVFDRHKGIAVFSVSGEASAEELTAGLTDLTDSLFTGEVSEEEAVAAAGNAAAALRAAVHDSAALEQYLLESSISGPECGPDELAELCTEITSGRLRAVLCGFQKDLILQVHAAEPDEDEAEG